MDKKQKHKQINISLLFWQQSWQSQRATLHVAQTRDIDVSWGQWKVMDTNKCLSPLLMDNVGKYANNTFF